MYLKNIQGETETWLNFSPVVGEVQLLLDRALATAHTSKEYSYLSEITEGV